MNELCYHALWPTTAIPFIGILYGEVALSVHPEIACALLVELVPGHEFKITVGAGQRSLETSVEKAGGLDHDHAGSAALEEWLDQDLA
jgi:hypothetical protein